MGGARTREREGTMRALTVFVTGGATCTRVGPSGTRCAKVVEFERPRFRPVSSFSFPKTDLDIVASYDFRVGQWLEWRA